MRSFLNRLRHHQPVLYQIKLLGRIGDDWSDWFDNMTIDVEDNADGAAITTLTGMLLDQATLYGLLRTASNLGLVLISVNCLAGEPIPGTNQAKS
jgi:hypothetical protein